MSPKLLRFGEACPGVLKVSCGLALWALRNLATSVNDLFASRLCSWSRMLARNSM